MREEKKWPESLGLIYIYIYIFIYSFIYLFTCDDGSCVAPAVKSGTSKAKNLRGQGPL